MDKKSYMEVEMEIIAFENEDVITTSPPDESRKQDEGGIF